MQEVPFKSKRGISMDQDLLQKCPHLKTLFKVKQLRLKTSDERRDQAAINRSKKTDAYKRNQKTIDDLIEGLLGYHSSSKHIFIKALTLVFRINKTDNSLQPTKGLIAFLEGLEDFDGGIIIQASRDFYAKCNPKRVVERKKPNPDLLYGFINASFNSPKKRSSSRQRQSGVERLGFEDPYTGRGYLPDSSDELYE